MKHLNKIFSSALMMATLLLVGSCSTGTPSTIEFTPDELMNKIKGGWAGQAIGVTYGGPTELRQ